jgi:hypothetical protein
MLYWFNILKQKNAWVLSLKNELKNVRNFYAKELSKISLIIKDHKIALKYEAR